MGKEEELAAAADRERIARAAEAPSLVPDEAEKEDAPPAAAPVPAAVPVADEDPAVEQHHEEEQENDLGEPEGLYEVERAVINAMKDDPSEPYFFVGARISLSGTGKYWAGGRYRGTIVDIRSSDNTIKVQYDDGGFKRFQREKFLELFGEQVRERFCVTRCVWAVLCCFCPNGSLIFFFLAVFLCPAHACVVLPISGRQRS
jgi:hypothetical protein